MRSIALMLFLSTTALTASGQTSELAAPTPPSSHDPSVATSLQRSFTEIARKAAQSIVTVRAYVRAGEEPVPDPDAAEGWGESALNDDYPGFQMRSAASGFIVSDAGDVLTCLHALQRPDGTLVDLVDLEMHDRRRIIGEVIGTEPTVNLAVVRCAVFPAGDRPALAPLAFGDSDAMECGAWVFGVGDPAGPEKFFAVGSFITRPSRDCYQELLSAFYIQAAMTAHPEAYGGPLLNLDGEVIGILSPRSPKPGFEATAPRFGVEFALPSKIVRGLYESLRQARSFRSPWLGVSVMSRAEIVANDGPDALATMNAPRHGILIENVFRPGPAALADVQPGDFLVKFDGNVVFSPVDFQRYLYLAGIGKSVKLEFSRGGKALSKELRVLERPAEALPR
jgi:S1-C subfamily serine protease